MNARTRQCDVFIQTGLWESGVAGRAMLLQANSGMISHSRYGQGLPRCNSFLSATAWVTTAAAANFASEEFGPVRLRLYRGRRDRKPIVHCIRFARADDGSGRRSSGAPNDVEFVIPSNGVLYDAQFSANELLFQIRTEEPF